MTTQSVKPNSLRAWLLAARPKTLTGAAVPVMLGCVLAWSDGKMAPAPDIAATNIAGATTSTTAADAIGAAANAANGATTDIVATVGSGFENMAANSVATVSESLSVLGATVDACTTGVGVNDSLLTTATNSITTLGATVNACTTGVGVNDSLLTTATNSITTLGSAIDAGTTGIGVDETLQAAGTGAHSAFILPALLCFAFAFLMQIDANLINDLWDYLKGTDREDRLGPERACAQEWITPRAMRRGIALTTAAAAITGCGLLFYGGWWLVPVGAACILFAFLYTAGPYPLAYHGWGDLLVLLFFGFVPVGCTYYILSGTWSWEVGVVSAACGLVIDTLLMVNNYRDREQDALSGKRTLIVRFGARTGERLYLLLGFAAAGLCLTLPGSIHTWTTLLPPLYLIPHTLTWRRMVRIGHGRALNATLGATSRNILLFGILLTIRLLL